MSLPAAIVTIGGVAAECDVTHAAIRHGRDDPSSQPNADSATLELVGALPASAEVGAALAIFADLGGAPIPRFAGLITDLAVSWDDPDTPVASVIAVGELAEMGRRYVYSGGGIGGFGEQPDGTRVSQAISAAGVTTDPARVDPGTLWLFARPPGTSGQADGTEPALTIALEGAIAGNGVLWEATDGAVLYADANHRRTAPTLTLDACDVPLGVRWRMGLEGLCNEVAVTYGATSPQGEARASDPASIAARGTYAAQLVTKLRDATEAAKRADLIVTRQAEPAWVVDGLGFPLQFLGAALTADLLGLEVHDLLTLTGLPASAPAPAAHLFVEGWTETIDGAGSWLLELAVSDYCRTAPPPRWDDVAPSVTWDSVGSALTWNDATCLPPPLP